MEEKHGFAKDPQRAKRLGAKGGSRKVPKGFAADPERARAARLKGLETRRKNKEEKLRKLQDGV